MRGIRLGRARRAILLAAEGGVIVSAGARSEAERFSRWRAARELEQIGLVRIEKRRGIRNDFGRHWHLLHATLTDLGRRVLDTYRSTFERGGRVRWARFEAHAAA